LRELPTGYWLSVVSNIMTRPMEGFPLTLGDVDQTAPNKMLDAEFL
jgi:hypothetical protein